MRTTATVLVLSVFAALGGLVPRAAADPMPTQFGNITGTVTGAGAPLPGVVVRASPNRGNGPPVLTATTRADGTFEIDGLGVESGLAYTVDYLPGQVTAGSSTGWIPTRFTDPARSGSQVSAVADETTPGIDADLSRAAAVSGTVRDGDGSPLVGATPTAITSYGVDDFQGEPVPGAVTDAAGHFHVVGLDPRGRWTVCLDTRTATGESEAGYLDGCLGDVRSRSSSIGTHIIGEATYTTVTAEHDTAVADIHVQRGAGLVGVVRDEAGNPVPDAELSFLAGNFWGEAVTDADGRYRLTASDTMHPSDIVQIPPERYGIDVGRNLLPYVPQTVFVTLEAGRVSQQDVVLPTAGRIVGSVTDGAGNALLGALVDAAGPAGAGGSDRLTYTATNAFDLEQLPPGRWTLCVTPRNVNDDAGVSRAGYLPRCAPSDDAVVVDVRAGRTSDVGAVALRAAARVTGTITDRVGHELQHPTVTITPVDGGPAVGVSYLFGHYTSFRIEPGRYRVCLSSVDVFAGNAADYRPTCLPDPVVLEPGRVTTANGVMIGVHEDVTPPTAGMTAPAAPVALSPAVTFAWHGADDRGGPVRYDARYRSAPWNAGYGPLSAPPSWQNTTVVAPTVTGSPGHTYCGSVRARDLSTNVSAYSAEHCTTIPLDDRSLTLGAGWARGTSTGSYAGTVTGTTSTGAALRLPNAYVGRLSLVVVRCRTCASVAIQLNGHTWRTVSTYAPTTQYRAVIPLPAFAAQHATISLVNVSRGRRLIVDGLAVSPS